MIRNLAGPALRQNEFAAAVVMPTLLRPSLTRAARSVFAQDFARPIQLLIGIDRAAGDSAQLAALAQDCPPHIALDIFDPGYSTSIQHGGLYPNRCSGSLRTILTYAANSRHVAYLDDDNWWAPDHLAGLKAAIDGRDWSWSGRWFVEPDSAEPICVDAWESVGPGAGLYAERYGGFVDPSSLMLDKLACHHIIPYWALSPYQDGRGEDRLIFEQVKDRPGGYSGRASSFYTMSETDPQHLVRLQQMRRNGIALPSDRRRGIVTLASLVAPPDSSTLPQTRLEPDPVLGPLLTLLRPAEALVLGPGDGAAALALAASVQATGVECLIAAADDEVSAVLRQRIAAFGAGFRLVPAGFFALSRLAVDLVLIGPDRTGPAAWQAGFAVLRPGGFLLGHDLPGPELDAFARHQHSRMLPLPEPAAFARWVIEKGVACS